jgi:hypothetical protein
VRQSTRDRCPPLGAGHAGQCRDVLTPTINAPTARSVKHAMRWRHPAYRRRGQQKVSSVHEQGGMGHVIQRPPAKGRLHADSTAVRPAVVAGNLIYSRRSPATARQVGQSAPQRRHRIQRDLGSARSRSAVARGV